jgi:carboxyl-terminal processing protease
VKVASRTPRGARRRAGSGGAKAEARRGQPALVALAGVALAVAGVTAAARLVPAVEHPIALQRGVAAWSLRAQEIGDEVIDAATQDSKGMDRPLTVPNGAPSALECDDARTVVAQARAALALPPGPIDAAKFAEATSDWLDPHGLWSVAPDAPVGALIRKDADRLLADLQAPAASPCVAAREIGARLHAWADELRRVFDEGAEAGRASVKPGARAIEEGFRIASATPFEDGTVTRSAKDLARELGRQAGVAGATFGPRMAPFVAAARAHAAPDLDDQAWSRVVIAAALRAYIPQLDAHGAWAPLDEEISIYDLSLEAEPPERLWTEMTRTAVGVRIDHGGLGPLSEGDVVLQVDDVRLAGISVEQAEQVSVVEAAHPGVATRVTVLRAHAKEPVVVALEPQRVDAGDGEDAAPASAPAELPHDLVRYGDGRVLVVAIHDVPDDLGPRLESTLDHARHAARDLRGVMLDRRANGGGSTDGAIAALGLFLPGAPLFPMRRRDGGVEVERAPEVSVDRRWKGPVAVLVDGDSASAAEMIAGAIGAYHRGPVVGDRTYGKGCAQEYLDDDAHTGVLRLTTLLYALPDGSAVQKTGIAPNVQLNLPPATEHEAQLTRALDAWRGPDVRDTEHVREVPWTTHAGRVGPCHDAVLCRALRAVGAQSAAAR